LPWIAGVVATANSVAVTTDTTFVSIGADGVTTGSLGEPVGVVGSERLASVMSPRSFARLSIGLGAWCGRTRNIGTVKKTVDATAAADIRARSHF
jgi:hypothetical protein